MDANTAKNIVLFVIRRCPSSVKIGAREIQKIPNMVSLSGSFQQGVVRFISSEESLLFTDAEEQSKRRLIASGTQMLKELWKKRK